MKCPILSYNFIYLANNPAVTCKALRFSCFELLFPVMWDANRENILFVATISLAVALGSFVLWGPSAPRKRKGHIVGLVNLGYTCFLNALLQAMASCPVVMDWLSNQQDIVDKKKSLTAALNKALRVVNGKEDGEDPFKPSEVIQTLLSKGWVISPGEQDAHELFLAIMQTLEEETQKPLKKVCSLLDAVENDPRLVRSETTHDVQHRSLVQLRSTVSCLETHNSNSENKIKPQLPFHGLSTSQRQCVSCQHKSAVHYTTFYNLSLVFPSRKISSVVPFYTIQELISNYVMNRVLNGVSCDGCGLPNTDQLETINFGKLPSCLCIHIARTIWVEGEPVKRDDYVQFSEFLNMDPYTYTNVQMKQISLSRLARGDEVVPNGSINVTHPVVSVSSFKNMYQLVAVVVHKGSLVNGHFVTYRRGVGHRYNRWYYTSDTEVCEATIDEVMGASAYMLFYTKYTSAVPSFAMY